MIVHHQAEEAMTDDEPETATLYLGDSTWHDGPGWYYVIDDYPDEGSCGSFATKEESIAHAKRNGYVSS
jgi:hypothetical protein